MEITIGNVKLTSKYNGIGLNKSTIIIIDVTHDPDNHVFDVDSEELKVAIEALEKTCWRP